jgi:hypothetical protein
MAAIIGSKIFELLGKGVDTHTKVEFSLKVEE